MVLHQLEFSQEIGIQHDRRKFKSFDKKGVNTVNINSVSIDLMYLLIKALGTYEMRINVLQYLMETSK